MLLPRVSRLVKQLFRQVARPSGSLQRHRRNSFRPRLELLEGRTAPAAFTWISTAAGTYNWYDSTNWVNGLGMHGVPGTGDSASVPANNITITQYPLQGTGGLGSLSVTGTGSLTLGVALSINGSVSSQGTLVLGNGYNSGGQTVAGSFTSQGLKVGGSLQVNGNFTNQTLEMLNGGYLTTPTVTSNNTITLSGGTIANATVNTNVQGTASGGTLSADVLNGNVDLTAAAASLAVANGLTLNGTLTMGNGTGTNANQLQFTNNATLGGSATVQMGTSSANQFFTTGPGTTLTLASSVAVHGSGALSGTIVNNGSITADAAGGTLSLLGTWTNHGTVAVASGSTLNLGGNGTWSSGANSSLGFAGSAVKFTGNLTLIHEATGSVAFRRKRFSIREATRARTAWK